MASGWELVTRKIGRTRGFGTFNTLATSIALWGWEERQVELLTNGQ